jgi:hypothetical protein
MPFAIIPSEEIAYRHDFPLLCNARGYQDAVEVGVDYGVFAADFLRRFEGHWLFLVDPYERCPEFDTDRTLDAMVAAQALMPYHGRFRFIRKPSPEAIPFVCGLISPSFVYIDGSHAEPDVYADIRSWWGVIPETGAIAGHDFDPLHPGVCAAVERFAREEDVVVRITSREAGDFPPSWYIYRTEPETLHVRFFDSRDIPNPHHAGPPAERNGQAGLPALSEAR